MEPTTNHFTVFLVLSTTFITCGANQKFVCPKAELIKPCYCEPATNGLISVNCFLSETWLSLKQSLRSLKKGKFAIGALKVRGLRDSSNKPHRIFTGLNIEELIIEDCSLPKNRLPGSIFHRASVIYLTVRNCLLTSVPTRALKPLKQLIYLDLSDNKISRLNNDSLKFVNSTLKYLGIANNSIAEFPSTLLKHLPNLEVLDVRQNQLLEIPSDAFIQNSKLSMLNLNSNLIREIDPTAFDPCPQLKFLGISSNDLNGSFSALEVLSHLEALEISDVQVDLKSFLPSNSTLTTLVLQNSRVHNGHVLSHFTNLKELDISDNRESFGNDSFLSLNAKAVFHNVVRLDISNSNLFPSMLISFPNLQELYANWNNVETLQNGDFRYTRHLKVLEMRMCGIRRINKRVFADTPGLISVNLSFNKLKRLTRHIFRELRNLREVDISYNPEFRATEEGKSVFDRPFFVKSCKSLTHLSLAFNDIYQLPRRCLQHLEGIKYLNLAGNYIKSIGDELAQNSELEVLVLRNNLINNIHPIAFKAMRKLTDLDLSHNQLQHFHQVYLPSNLESLKLNENQLRTVADRERNPVCNLRSSIRHLNLSSNRLYNMSPKWFFNCTPNLISLDISGNFVNCSQSCPMTEFRAWASTNRIVLTGNTHCSSNQQENNYIKCGSNS